MLNQEVKSDYYTYGLANPLKSSKENYIGGDSLHEYEFFYFGYSGREERLDEHLKCYNSDKNYHKKNTIRKIQRNGEEVIFVKILENVDEQPAIDKEIEMIAYYGRSDKGLGPLTNLTDGGEGNKRGRENLTGRKFGRLLVIEFKRLRNENIPEWVCLCECGNEKVIRSSSLKNGSTKSCGCLQKEIMREMKTRHPLLDTTIYNTWKNMLQKHNNKICDRWLESFDNFYEDMGDRISDKYMLSRINKNGIYEASNCKWMTREDCHNNRKNTIHLTVNNKTHSLKEWSNISGTNYCTMKDRYRKGWKPEEIICGKV